MSCGPTPAAGVGADLDVRMTGTSTWPQDVRDAINSVLNLLPPGTDRR